MYLRCEVFLAVGVENDVCTLGAGGRSESLVENLGFFNGSLEALVHNAVCFAVRIVGLPAPGTFNSRLREERIEGY